MARRSALLTLAVTAFLGSSFATGACSSDASPGNPGPDGGALDGASSDGAGPATSDAGVAETGTGACGNVDPLLLDGATKAFGLWRWSKQLSGGTETDLDACDQTTHYRVGPAALGPNTTVRDYVACILSERGVIPVTSGRINPDVGCAPFGCVTSKLGLVWSTETSGSVFELDGNGKPKGPAVFRLVIYPHLPNYELLWTGSTGTSGYVMVGPDLADHTILSCQ